MPCFLPRTQTTTSLVSSCLWMMTSKMSTTSALNTNATSKGGPAALIFLHGLGDTPQGWSSLETMLPSIAPRLSQLTYVFPAAPTIPISINGGMTMPGWFDVLDWPIGIKARDDREGMIAMKNRILQEVTQQIQQEHQIPKSRIVVGGFSQGGAIAILSAYHPNNDHDKDNDNDNDDHYAGCVSLSGWLTLEEDLLKRKNSTKKLPPLFWGHGQYDDKVLFEQQSHGIQVLQDKLDVDVTFDFYPVGHSSDPEEIQALAHFLDDLLYGDDADENNETKNTEKKASS